MYYHLEKYEEAIQDCERAASIDPTFTKAYYRQGLSHYERVQSPESQIKAIELFRKASELDPDNSEMRDILNFASEELKEDNHVPV